MNIQPKSKCDGQSLDKSERILKAASECFMRYGFKRTAMNDISKSAGISRAALYLLFQNKEDIFRTALENLHGQAILRAEAALQSELKFSERLMAAFEGKDLEILGLVYDSSHGIELMEMSSAIGADIFQAAEQRFVALLTEAIRQAVARGEIKLSEENLQPQQCASLLISCTYGLRKSSASITEYREQLRHLISIFDLALISAN
jgi:AcrR family transcriptional regulator